jgi:hypothetical protein
MDNLNASITIGLSSLGFYPALFSLMGIRSGLRSLKRRDHDVMSIYYILRNISREILSLKEHVNSGILSKSEEYEVIMGKYNSAVTLYNEKANHVVSIAEAGNRTGDLRHCPTCSTDIGKEVSRSRNCPTCKNRIIFYRLNPDKCVLLTREDEELVIAAVKACNDVIYPDVMNAYVVKGEMLSELNKRISIEDERERIDHQANDLLIS